DPDLRAEAGIKTIPASECSSRITSFPSLNSQLLHSLRQLRAGLLRDHILGVPIRPVRVSLAGPFFVLAVRCLRPPKRARQIARRTEHRCCGIDPARKTRRDFLEQPAVPVRIFE